MKNTYTVLFNSLIRVDYLTKSSSFLRRGLFIVLAFSILTPLAGFSEMRNASVLLFSAASRSKTDNRVPAGMILTWESCLRGWEGELVFMIGDPPRPVAPPLWQSAAAGRVDFVTSEAGCRYVGSVCQTDIPDTTESIAVGILSVTATNVSSNEISPILWIAWRPVSPLPEGQKVHQGFLLIPFRETEDWANTEPAVWNPTRTWYFRNQAFMENQNLLYWISNSSAWETTHWVQIPKLPYLEITEISTFGYVRFTGKLRANQYDVLQIVVPYFPLSGERRLQLQKAFPE